MNQRTRSYRSVLREEQAEATALRIVEAAVRILQGRPALLSVPAVAREAGVSVATVYHHFSGKEKLIRAVSDYLDRHQTGWTEEPRRPTSPEELAAHVRVIAPLLNGRQALMAPALRLPEGDAVRREQMADRISFVTGALAALSERMPPEDYDNLISIATVLCTSETFGLLQEHLGLSPQGAGEAVAWAIANLTQEQKS